MSIFAEAISRKIQERIGGKCPKCGGSVLSVVWREVKGWWHSDHGFTETEDATEGYVAICVLCEHPSFICRGDEAA